MSLLQHNAKESYPPFLGHVQGPHQPLEAEAPSGFAHLVNQGEWD